MVLGVSRKEGWAWHNAHGCTRREEKIVAVEEGKLAMYSTAMPTCRSPVKPQERRWSKTTLVSVEITKQLERTDSNSDIQKARLCTSFQMQLCFPVDLICFKIDVKRRNLVFLYLIAVNEQEVEHKTTVHDWQKVLDEECQTTV